MPSKFDVQSFYANENGADPLKDAFSKRRAVMPFRGTSKLECDDLQSEWIDILSQPSERSKRLAYIHVPFCANHCLFCGFYRNAYVPQIGAGYIDLVIDEIFRDASRLALRNNPIHAIYLGGGTPTALSADELSRLLLTVRKELPLAPDCEITVEGRIIHFTDDKIDACLEAGTNRFSIGVQSFDTDVRRRQGRKASREDAIRFLEGIRDRDRAALIIDLIYGLPGQTLDVWQRDLETAAELGPDGIDLYGLNIIPGTPLFTAISAGKFPATAGLSDIGVLYQIGVEFFRRRNWCQLTNNHWGRTTRERNLYNILIKEGADCLAFGSGAGGSIGPYSYGLKSDLSSYLESVSSGFKPLGMLNRSDGNQHLRNFITASFEVGFLDLSQLLQLADHRLSYGDFVPLVQQWQRSGLLTLNDNIIELSVAGRFWYANLISAFQDILQVRLLPTSNAA